MSIRDYLLKNYWICSCLYGFIIWYKMNFTLARNDFGFCYFTFILNMPVFTDTFVFIFVFVTFSLSSFYTYSYLLFTLLRSYIFYLLFDVFVELVLFLSFFELLWGSFIVFCFISASYWFVLSCSIGLCCLRLIILCFCLWLLEIYSLSYFYVEWVKGTAVCFFYFFYFFY